MADATTCPTAAPADPRSIEPPPERSTPSPPGPAETPGPQQRSTAPAEAVVSLLAAVCFMLWARSIDVNPLVRIGQVSGLAALQLRAAVIGVPVLAALLYVAHRTAPGRYPLVLRLGCAVFAGLGTGLVAGGVVVALNGTPWGLGGQEGDPGNVMGMADDMIRGKGLPGVYPPLFPALLVGWGKLFHGAHGGVAGVAFAMKDLQVLCTAVAGPMTYLAWRLLLRPFWALLVAVPSAVLFIDPIRPYSHGAMLVMLPVLAVGFRELRRSHELSARSAVARATALGASIGLLFLWYSGWFVWAAPGVLVLVGSVLPWRKGAARLKRALLFLAVAAASAALVGAPLLYQLVRLGATTKDRYAMITVYADPAYVMGWMSDRPGTQTYHNWPLSGELAGQSAFTLLVLAAAALAIGLGSGGILVRTVTTVLVSSWLLRFWFASQLERTQAVQLYPRTTWIIMYCLIVLAVLGLMLAAQRVTAWSRTLSHPGSGTPGTSGTSGGPSLLTIRRMTAGGVCAIALFAAMAGSWSANRYMPTTDPGVLDMGLDARRAHLLKDATGHCPRYSPVATCAGINQNLSVRDTGPDDLQLWCANVPGPDWPTTCGRKAPWI
ncbi:hypothetical protein ABTZ03_32910 [Kitasatospora sp. NPDC096077]|uniref:hypothetical protein n=1 Tax=Kitasatospora sp. NPDC096077 TaxID=3155544 RepID=UPI00332E81CE